MPIITLNEVDYHYEIQGSGPTLLLLHGFTGTALSWSDQVAGLKDQFQVISIDLLGHGRSAKPAAPDRYSMPAVKDDFATFFAELNLTEVNLLGYSMGGRLALFLGLSFPGVINRLVLESASPGLQTAEERQTRRIRDENLAENITRNGIESFVDQWQNLPLFASQERVSQKRRNRLRTQRLANDPIGLANSLRGMGTGAQPNLWPELNSIQQPVLLLAGALDRKFEAINRRMAALLPRAEINILNGCGHNIHFEEPDRFTRVVIDSLLKDRG